jgi:hypothetical protein
MPASDVAVMAVFETITGTGELLPPNPLKAWKQNGKLHITGLTVGESLSIYTATGVLVYHNIATSEEKEINLYVSGVYVVRSGNNTVKVVYE